jgi:mannosyltransferase
MRTLILLLLLTAALRLHDLGAQSLWYDEGSSYVQSTRTLSEIADHAARDIHPPGYYWILAGWRVLMGESEFALRSLSAFASIISATLTYAIGRRLIGRSGGIFALMFVALNSFSIYYAQEARMYALLTLWSAASLYALIRLIERPTPRLALTLGLLNAAGLWTHYAFPFFMLAQGVIVVLTMKPRRWIAFAGASLLAIAIFAPWIPTALHQLTTWGQVRDAIPLEESLLTLVRWLTFGISADANAPLIAPLVLLFGLVPLGRSRLGLIVPILWVIVPVGIFLAFDLFREANLKFLLPAQIGMALWLARGLVGVRMVLTPPGQTTRLPRWAIPALMIIMLTDGALRLYGDPAYQRPDYRAAVTRISAESRSGDAIILSAPNQIEVFSYYYNGDLPIYPLPVGLSSDDDATRAAVEDIIMRYRRVYVLFYGENERDPRRVVETTLDAGAFELDDTWYGDLRLARYVMPASMQIERVSGAKFGGMIALVSYALSAETLSPGDVLQVRLDWRAETPLTQRYKVFVQLLDASGVLAAQRDSEPGGGLALTTTWTPGEIVSDNHALFIPDSLPSGTYRLIVGLYELDPPNTRLTVGEVDFLNLGTIRLR